MSPLALGNGTNDETDKDIIVDSNGNPYIPGSSLAGVYRSMLEGETAEKYFGKKLIKDNEIDESHIIVYDAILSEDSRPYIGKRDMVALDCYKVAVDGAKFDFQMVEPGLNFLTYVEQNVFESDDADTEVMKDVFAIWKESGISFGAKTMRGYGLTKAIKVERAAFDLSAGQADAWIDFDVYDDKGWEACELSPAKDKSWSVELILNQKGGVSVREYSTNVGEADYEQMKLHSNKDKVAVIPGTSWAGAFRSQMKTLGMSDEDLKKLFGTEKGKSPHRSHISFGSIIFSM